MIDLDHVRGVALECRAQFDARAVDPELLARLWSLQRPDIFPDPAEAVPLLREQVQWFPTACCRSATLYLRHLLGFGVLGKGLFDTTPHEVLSLGEVLPGEPEQIADITANQFNTPTRNFAAVYVGPLIAPWSIHARDESNLRFRRMRAERPGGRHVDSKQLY